MDKPEEMIARVMREVVTIKPYDPHWLLLFEEEKKHLLSCLPKRLIRRIEHFGSIAIPGLPAKPIVDILIEVSDLEKTKHKIAPILQSQGYDYFWRPSWGNDVPPFYAWFIKRGADGNRTHHIHMVEAHFEHWDRLLFRDYLIEHPKTAEEYAKLKLELSQALRQDRVGYTNAKTEFIVRVTEMAKKYYKEKKDINPLCRRSRIRTKFNKNVVCY